MRLLFIVTAVLETATAVLLLLVPALVFAFLFGWRGIGPQTALIARVGGGAVLSLAVASWFARDDAGSRAGLGVFTGLLVYNVLTVVFFVFAGVGLSMVGLLLWPAVLCHVALTAWGVDCLRRQPERQRR